MKLSTKLALSFCCVITVLLVLSAAALRNIAAMNERIDEMDAVWLPSVIAIQSMNVDLNAVRADLASILSQTYVDEIRKYEKSLAASLADIQKNYALYATLIDVQPAASDSRDKALMARIADLSKEEDAIRAKLVKNMLDGRRGPANALFNSKYRPVFDELGKTYAQAVELNVTGSREVARQAAEIGQRARRMTVALALAAVLISLGIAWRITRSVGLQLGKDPGELAVIARRVAEGDYSYNDDGPKTGVYAHMTAMVAALKKHMEQARRESENARAQSQKATAALQQAEEAGEQAAERTQAMREAALRLEEVAQVVSSASSVLAAQIEQSDRGAQETSQRLSEAATAMTQMNATVQEVARNAAAASAASAETREKAESGAAVVRRSLQSIDAVQHVSLDLKADMARLEEHTQAISRIMGVISDIADQTNLLALNAAIEAARAGEAGRGFAVVADEVRKLAEKTMASTHDVGAAIQAIQGSASQSAASADKAVEQIGAATNFARQSGDALEAIVSTVETTADQVGAIAAASEEQSAASEEINRTMGQVSQMSAQTAQAMTEAARAVPDLAAQTRNLMDLMGSLRAQ